MKETKEEKIIPNGVIKYYARVSTVLQNASRQTKAFEKYKDIDKYDGADELYIDKCSGKDTDRPELQKMLNNLQAGDTVVVKSMDRLSRSMKDMFELVEIIKSKKAILKILDFNGMECDTTSAMGEFFLLMSGAMSQLERRLIRERQDEGIEIAKTKNIYKGREKGTLNLVNQDKKKRFIKLYNQGINKAELSKIFNVSRPTVYNWISILKENGEIK